MGVEPGAKLEAVRAFLSREKSRSTLARDLGVTERTIRNWTRRYLVEGSDGLSDLRARVLGPGARVGPQVVDLVVDAKRRNPHLGVRRLQAFLTREHGVQVSFKTVHRILSHQGLAHPGELVGMSRESLHKI
ncbi:MAG: helix-turn-helix domain-containing protein [Methanobacteriota archaeon]